MVKLFTYTKYTYDITTGSFICVKPERVAIGLTTDFEVMPLKHSLGTFEPS